MGGEEHEVTASTILGKGFGPVGKKEKGGAHHGNRKKKDFAGWQKNLGDKPKKGGTEIPGERGGTRSLGKV